MYTVIELGDYENLSPIDRNHISLLLFLFRYLDDMVVIKLAEFWRPFFGNYHFNH